MRLNRKQLQAMIDDARRRFIEMPAETRLAGEASSLSEPERLGLCFLIASLGVASRHGVEDIELDVADSEPDTEP